MAKLLATAAAILTLLYFVLAADVSDCRTTITTTTTTTTFNDETCEEKISGADLEACKSYVTRPTRDLPGACCGRLYPLGDNTCRCEAMNMIVKELIKEGNYNAEMIKSRAGIVVTHCQIGTTPESCLRDAALSSILKNNI